MARLLNLLIVIFELIAFYKARKRQSFKESFMFYTQLSNMITCIASLLLVIFGQKKFVEVLRLTSVGMLAMTFFVTVFILVPMSKMVKELLFSGSGLFHHLLIPIISVLSYNLAEDKVSMVYIVIPVVLTLIYGITMLVLNAKEKVDGPYPFFRVNKLGRRMTALWTAALILAVSILSFAAGFKTPAKTDMKFIFVHGLAGWGSYDTLNEFFPYWGLSGGSIIRYLNDHGYESYAASVDPTGSAWDRACELYAQLTGTRVDYGKAHSEAAGHERFGEDFTGRALVSDIDSSRYVLIGHSFGGATIRVFSELIRNGDEREMATSDENDVSPLFKGGNGDNLFAIVMLAAPSNGTTAYDLYEDENFDLSMIDIPQEYEENSDAVSNGTRPVLDGRKAYDYASFDMHIDNALELNERITTFDDVYYLAYPCSSTTEDDKGNITPDPAITENMFMKGSIYMSRYTGKTKGGFILDESWQSNDGLVNEISAGAPFNAPHNIYKADTGLKKGMWNVMPTFKGDHMSLQGGLTKRINVKPFYMEMVKLLSDLPDRSG